MEMNLVIMIKELRRRRNEDSREKENQLEKSGWRWEETSGTTNPPRPLSPWEGGPSKQAARALTFVIWSPEDRGAARPLDTACVAPSYTACWRQSHGPAGLLLPGGWLPAVSP